MSTSAQTVATTPESARSTSRKPSLGTLVSTELLKIRTTRTVWILGIIALVLAALMTLFFTLLTVNPPDPELDITGFSPEEPAVIRSIYGTGFQIGYIFLAVIGILGMSGEYRNQTITGTLLAAPRRMRLVAAKFLTYSIVGAVLSLMLTAVSVVVGGIILKIKGYDLLLTEGSVLRTLGLCILAGALWTVLGLGLGTLIKNQVVAIVVIIMFLWVAESLLNWGLTRYSWGEKVTAYLPSNASNAIINGATPENAGPLPDMLPWWGGVLVLFGYAAIAAVGGALLQRRRDIS